MRILLPSAREKSLFLLPIVLIAGSVIFFASRVSLAALSARTWTHEGLLRAVGLEPGNAVYWYHLGLYENWNLDRPDLRRAIGYYRRAAAADPRSDTYWANLADAYEAAGQPEQAGAAFQNALSAHPASSDVAWRYGNFLLRQRRYPEAFAEIRRALDVEPSLTSQAVSECSKVSADVSGMLGQILPDRTPYYVAALDYFVGQNQADAALQAWNRLLSLKPTVTMQQALPLVDELLRQQRVQPAVSAWRQALAVTGWPRDADPVPGIVFNGGFEHELLNGGFDWHEDPIPGAAYEIDTNVVHAGSRAVRVTFDGSANVNFQHLWQFVAVEPNHRYHFTAYLRLDQVSTDSGVRFLIFDPSHAGALQIQTPSLTGSQPWSPVEQDIQTSPMTNLLVIALRRAPSWKFDNKLSGSVWLDDVSLVSAPENSRAGVP
jgi:tetratricopeptide (TPR) repeat protein